MLRRALTRLAVVSVLFVIVGCAAPAPTVEASSDRLADIRTLAVISAPEPKTYAVMNFGHPGMAFGLIGGLIAASDQASKEGRLAAVFKAAGTDFSGSMASRLVEQMRSMGYDTRLEDGAWDDINGTYKLNIEKVQSSADAILVVSPSLIGFVATDIGSDYLPSWRVEVSLHGKDRNSILYRGFFATGWAPNIQGWKNYPSRRTFPNFDSLMADTPSTVVALEEAGAHLADGMAKDLRR